MKHLAKIDDLLHGAEEEDIFDLESAYIEAVSAVPVDDHRQGVFHPSAADSCARRNVYEYIRTPSMSVAEIYGQGRSKKDKTTAGKAASTARGESVSQAPDLTQDRDNLDFGHATHGLVQSRLTLIKEHFEAKGFKFKLVIEAGHDPRTDMLRLTYGIGGTADAVIEVTDPQGNTQRGILEIKSIKDRLFKELKGPKRGHVEQAHIYAWRFDCPVIWIWYFNKDNADRQVFGMHFDPAILDNVLHRFVEQRAHAEAGTLPERDMSAWMCARCQFRGPCNPPILMASAGRDAVRRARARGLQSTGTIQLRPKK